MPRGIYMTPKDMMILEGYKQSDNAWNKLKTICAALGKERITVKEYARYNKVDLEEVLEALEPKKKKAIS